MGCLACAGIDDLNPAKYVRYGQSSVATAKNNLSERWYPPQAEGRLGRSILVSEHGDLGSQLVSQSTNFWSLTKFEEAKVGPIQPLPQQKSCVDGLSQVFNRLALFADPCVDLGCKIQSPGIAGIYLQCQAYLVQRRLLVAQDGVPETNGDDNPLTPEAFALSLDIR
jgi:hypothetical protein